MMNTDPSTSNSVVTVGSAATDRDVLFRALLGQLPQLIPGIPNVTWLPMILGQVRGALAVLGGLGVGWAKDTGEPTVTLYGSLILIVVVLVWSAYQWFTATIAKYRAAAASGAASAAATAHASAACPAGTAQAVAVTPIDPRKPTPLPDLAAAA